MSRKIQVADLPLFLPLGFEARWPQGLGSMEEADKAAIVKRAPEQAHRSEEVRAAVRSLLRAGGYRPSGRGKPASEYLVKAVAEGGLPTINACVDTLNVVSFVSGIPISVVDVDKTKENFSIRNGKPGEEYVFNQSNQLIKVEGLLSLCDGPGPCANAVKDSQRTKTDSNTTHTFHILWAPASQAIIAQAAYQWYLDETRAAGAEVTPWP